MGMYDYVDFKEACPLCGIMLAEWQTQDMDDPNFRRVPTSEISNWYTDCLAVVYEHELDNPPADANWLNYSEGRFMQVGCGAWLEYLNGELTVTPKGGS